MIKKILLSAVATAAMMPMSAMAATVTSPAGFTMNVSSACSVTGVISNLGTFVAGQTGQDYANRQGVYGPAGFTPGSAANVPIANVQCPTGTAWQLVVLGSGTNGATNAVAPGGAVAFQTFPTAYSVDGAATQRFLYDATGVSGTGNGASQVVAGQWTYDSYDSAAPASVVLVTGSYTGSATATLTF